MFELENNQLIRVEMLDQENYFQSLFGEACKRHVLEHKQIERIQMELIEQLAKQTERYTNDESSSIRVETAQQLLQSIAYCLGVYLKSVTGVNQQLELLKEDKISVLFYRGIDRLSELMKLSKNMLLGLQKEHRNINNIAYQDTLFTALPDFFHDYNMEFAAYDVPCSIDYPLCNTITGLTGIEYINEYLHRFTLEHRFCMGYSEDILNQLLKSFDKDSEHLLINLFELTLTNVIGCELVGANTEQLLLQKSDLLWLQNNLIEYSLEELQRRLYQVLEQIKLSYTLEEEIVSYALPLISSLSVRMNQNLKTGTIDQIFITEKQLTTNDEMNYIEGDMMEDEQLRKLMEEIRDCDTTADKIRLLRENVHSLMDLVELLEDCFYDEEFDEVFQLLNETEQNVLTKIIQEEIDYKGVDEKRQLKEWQERLLRLHNV